MARRNAKRETKPADPTVADRERGAFTDDVAQRTRRESLKGSTTAEADLHRAPPLRLALSIPEFCEAFSISEDFFYKLKRQGKAPRQMKVGARTLISMEAAAEWRREREAAAVAEPR